MLYGSKEFIDDLITSVNKIENENSFNMVFGSTIGSISRGIERFSSDYDVRFLYVDKSYRFLEKHDRHTENRIRYRAFYESKAYNCIAFWEVSAFLNFLCEPYIDNDVQYKLVRNVLWTFTSPYRYDPYGIGNKILPILNKTINLECEMKHHYEILARFLDMERNSVSIPQYLSAIHAYLSLKWLKNENSAPPMHIATLLTIADYELNNETHSVLKMNQKENNKNIDNIRISISNKTIEHIEDIVKTTRFREINISGELKKNENYVNDMLDIIRYEFESEQKVCSVK